MKIQLLINEEFLVSTQKRGRVVSFRFMMRGPFQLVLVEAPQLILCERISSNFLNVLFWGKKTNKQKKTGPQTLSDTDVLFKIPCPNIQTVDQIHEIPSGLQINVNLTSFVNEGARCKSKK